MEVLVWFCVVCLWWAASLTVLFPFLILLKYSKYFRDIWFPFVYTKILAIFGYQHIPLRKRLFELLNEELSGRDIRKPLKILEIGIGSGPNLRFYPANSHLTTLDMNINFESYFKQNRQKYRHIVYERTVIGVAENMKGIDDCSMDVVVSTLVLCSVTNVKDSLKEIKRVLKPGGKFLFYEHVGHPKSQWGYTLQKFASPLWYIYFDHCCLLRDIRAAIEKAEFSEVKCDTIFPKYMNVLLRAQIIGIARK